MLRVARSLRTQSRVAGEPARPHVHHHGELGDPGTGRQPQIDHPGDQLGRQVVGDVPAEILEHLGGSAAPRAGKPGDQNDVDARFRAGVAGRRRCPRRSSRCALVRHPDALRLIIADHRVGRCRIGRYTERLQHGLGSCHADTRHRGDLLDGGLLQPGQRTEVRDQRLAPVLPQPGHRVQRRRRHPLGPLAAVVGDREPVCFVAHPLQQIQPFAVARHDDRDPAPTAPTPPPAVWPARSPRRR